jgi:DNA polymerase-4
VRHPELGRLSIAHIDCDAFYASIEKRDNPAIRDKPVIVGGGTRGVVSTCCYIARTFGVRSAMPMFKARALCPDAVVVKPDMAKYAAVGREVRARMLALTPLVEPLSIDEAFLDLTGTERLHGGHPALVLARFAAAVEKDLGITVSVGLSYCKFLAKMASDLDKPRGFAVIGEAEAQSFLAPLGVGAIWGIGKVGEERLKREGFATIGDLQRADQADVLRRIGPEGTRLWKLARGIDDRHVSPDRETKSVSAETTFNTDVADSRELARDLFRLSEKVSSRLKAAGISGRTVTLKLKTADFRLRTRARALPEPTQLAARIFEAGRALLEKEVDGTRFRLIGIGVSDLDDADAADHGDLVDTRAGRDKATEAAVDALRAKFGKGAVVKGIAFEGPEPEARPSRRGE